MDSNDIRELKSLIGDRLFLRVANWNLYLGDAGLAEPLAAECIARLNQGAQSAAKAALEEVQVPLGGGSSNLPLANLVPSSQFHELEDILSPYCR